MKFLEFIATGEWVAQRFPPQYAEVLKQTRSLPVDFILNTPLEYQKFVSFVPALLLMFADGPADFAGGLLLVRESNIWSERVTNRIFQKLRKIEQIDIPEIPALPAHLFAPDELETCIEYASLVVAGLWDAQFFDEQGRFLLNFSNDEFIDVAIPRESSVPLIRQRFQRHIRP